MLSYVLEFQLWFLHKLNGSALYVNELRALDVKPGLLLLRRIWRTSHNRRCQRVILTVSLIYQYHT
jgi:hypothetical protein